MGAGKNPFNDFSTGYGPAVHHALPPQDLGMGGSVPRADSRPSNAWEDTEEVSLGDTNGKGGWNTAAAAPSGSSDKDIKKREKELNKREKELAKKEEDLRRREEAVAAAGGVVKEVKNWPRCFPIIHHDIDGDIGPNFARAVKAAWITFWGFAFASTWNLIAAIVALCVITGSNKPGGLLPGMFLALIYLLAGVPLAYLIWYKPLYRGAQNDKAFGFAWFFLASFALLVFTVWSAVGPDILVSQFSHAGVLSTITCFDYNTVAGIFFLIGAAFWVLESLLILVVIKMVYTRFRGRGSNASTLQQEMAESLSRRQQKKMFGGDNSTNNV